MRKLSGIFLMVLLLHGCLKSDTYNQFNKSPGRTRGTRFAGFFIDQNL